MRDLRARLRDIVRRENDTRGRNPASNPGSEPGVQQRGSFTYSAELDSAADVRDTAAQLGGTVHEIDGSTCVVVDRVWDADDWHGRRRVASFAPDTRQPIGLFDPRLAAMPRWAERVVFFDLETTGLSGGAGTIPFVVGCGWFDEGRFLARQFVLAGPAGEHAMLDALAGVLGRTTLLVTFNGASFDLPTMEMRWAFHRQANPADGLPHFDMLPPARRFWRRREASADPTCTLTALERSVIGFFRVGDVPGFEIPARYFHFLRTGDATAIGGVLDHNRYDLLSLAAIMAHALALAEDGPDACAESGERLALGQLYERAGDLSRAARAFELAAGDGPRDVRQHALARLAVLQRRDHRHADAAAAWQQVIDLAPAGALPTPLERRAAEALAIHHEHRARDFAEARRYAVRLGRQATGRQASETTHRIARIDRKIGAAEHTKGGLSAAPLFTHDERPPER
jgi:uncharacterized protein YprB with RNaseH-like and TPR domain